MKILWKSNSLPCQEYQYQLDNYLPYLTISDLAMLKTDHLYQNCHFPDS
ncbi:hypothetical protein BVRB_3g048360 [Beta vulgaris subsp. vulgaris]|nr:hypothetical protein BVRB_3g048360 [Beta vulgaris subsp. vulgaris]